MFKSDDIVDQEEHADDKNKQISQDDTLIWYSLRKKFLASYINFLDRLHSHLVGPSSISDYQLLIHDLERKSRETARKIIEQVMKFLENHFLLLISYTNEHHAEFKEEWNKLLAHHRGLIFGADAYDPYCVDKIVVCINNDLINLEKNILDLVEKITPKSITEVLQVDLLEKISLCEVLNEKDVSYLSQVNRCFYNVTSSFWKNQQTSLHQLIDLIYRKGKIGFLLRLCYLEFAYLRVHSDEATDLDLKFKNTILFHYSEFLAKNDDKEKEQHIQSLRLVLKDFDQLIDELLKDEKPKYIALKINTLSRFCSTIMSGMQNDFEILKKHITELCDLYRVEYETTILEYLNPSQEMSHSGVIPLIIPDNPKVQYDAIIIGSRNYQRN